MKKLLFTITLLITSLALHSQCFNSANVYSFDYNGHSYKVVKENKNWIDASGCAVSDGGYLTEINDVDEQNTIFSEVTNNAGIILANTRNEFGTAAVWIGGSDSQNEGTWIWDGDNDDIGEQFWEGGPNGNPIGGLYSNWGTNPPEPDNSGNQDKLTLTIETNHPNFSKWNDLSNISNTIYYIIEYDSILSIGENNLNDKIKIYPNPFKDFVNIDNNSTLKILKLDVFNNLGQIIHTQNSFSNSTKVDLSNIENGIYYLNLLLEDGKHVEFKIVR